MASIKYTALINEIKGTINGTTFQGGYGGAIVKSKNISSFLSKGRKAAPISGVVRFLKPKAIISKLSSNWKSLTPEQRLSWSAAAPNYPFKNRFSETYIASGFQVYMSINTNLLSFSLTELSVAPIPGIVPDPPVNSPGVFLTVGGIIIFFTNYQNAGDCQRFSVSQPVNSSVSPVGLSFQVIKVTSLDTSFEVDVTAETKATRGSFAVGQVFWFKFETINHITGQVSVPSFASATIIA